MNTTKRVDTNITVMNSIMLKQLRISSENPVTTDYINEFYKEVQEKWYKTSKPYEYVTTVHPPGVKIIANNNVNQRIVNTSNYEWQFTLLYMESETTKKLHNVLLMFHSDYHKEKFALIEVLADESSIGRKSKLQWHLDEDEALTMPQPQKYIVKIKFQTNFDEMGVYRADVIFHFGKWPVTLMRLCVHYTTNETTIQCERNTQKYNPPISWKFNKNLCIFHTEDDYDEREINMSDLYPYPDKQNYFLTDNICSDPSFEFNFRGCLHETITAEELAQNFMVSKFDQTVMMNIKSQYDIQDLYSGCIRTNIARKGLFGELHLIKKLDDSCIGTLIVNKCRYVLLKRNGWKDIRAPIIEKGTEKIYVELNVYCVHHWHLKPQDVICVELQFVLDRLNFCNWHWAVDSLSNINNLIPKVTNVPNPSNKDLFDMPLPEGTKRQRLIMYAIISENVSPVVIKSTYGSGKKYVIAYSIKQLLTEPNRDCKILLSTKNNTVADLYISQYFHDFYEETKSLRLKPIRIYDKRCLLETVDPTILQYCLTDNKSRFREPTETDFQTSSYLIVTTHTTAMCLVDLDISLTHVIIEEAGAIAIWEALIPLALTSQNTRVIYIGHMQHIRRALCGNEIYKINYSILYWIYERVFKKVLKDMCKMKQSDVFRMPMNLTMYVSKGLSSSHSRKKKMNPCRIVNGIIKFFAVFGKEEKENSGLKETIGYKNDEEAEELAKRVEQLKNNWPEFFGEFGKNSIRVFTRDTAQIYKLQSELRAHGIGKEVIVEDVYNACGTQYPAVFISTVRSSRSTSQSTNDIDDSFVFNQNLIMLAMSRVMDFVAVVGDPIALLNSGSDKCKHCWKEYLELVLKEHRHTESLYGIQHEDLESYLHAIPGTSR